MTVIPAIDLHGGECVRLFKGDYGTAHKVAESAVDTALGFKAAGAEIIHVVDLDGAKDGVRSNGAIIRDIVEKGGLPVELGGGIRGLEDMKQLNELGVYRFILGSAAVESPELVSEAVELYGADRVAVSIDCKDGFVRTRGWIEETKLKFTDFAREMEKRGAERIIFTDIDTDGMLSGPPLSRLRELMGAVGCKITASGGVGSLKDVEALARLGVDAMITGKAVYTGDLDLRCAIAAGKEK